LIGLPLEGVPPIGGKKHPGLFAGKPKQIELIETVILDFEGTGHEAGATD
jgi:hypothetical protein